MNTMKKKNENKDTANSAVIHDFLANLTKAISDTGLTPYAWAIKIGLDKQAISRFLEEGHEPKLSTAIRIVKGLQISMDKLLGIAPVKLEESAVQPQPVPEVEIKTEKIGFINKIAKMHDQDVELLEAIAGILDERRSRAMARLLHAVNDAAPPDDKNGLMAKATKSLNKPKSNKSVSDDDLEDEDIEEDFDGEDDVFDDEFEDDDIFDDDFDDDDLDDED